MVKPALEETRLDSGHTRSYALLACPPSRWEEPCQRS